MKIRTGIILIIAILITGTAMSQNQKPLSLPDAINLGIKNSHTLAGSQGKIEEATAALREAVERKLPDVKVSGSYIRLNTANFSLKSKDNSGSGGSGESPKVNQAVYGLVNASLPIYTGGK